MLDMTNSWAPNQQQTAAFVLFVDLQDSVYDGDLSAFNPEDNDLPHPDGILHPVGEKQQVSSVESRLHAATVTETILIKLFKTRGNNKSYFMLT